MVRRFLRSYAASQDWSAKMSTDNPRDRQPSNYLRSDRSLESPGIAVIMAWTHSNDLLNIERIRDNK